MKKTFLLSALILSSVVAAQTADAAPDKTSSNDAVVELKGGYLTLGPATISDFGQHKLTAETRDIYAALSNPITVDDARGTREGWNLQVKATDFVEVEPAGGFASGTIAHTFSAQNMSLMQPILTNTTFAGATVDPGVTVFSTAELQLNNLDSKVAGAIVDQGMGQHTLTFDSTKAVKLKLDPSIIKIDNVNYPGTFTPYSTTITWTVSTGPGA